MAKNIQFLRNATAFKSKQEAIEGLQGLTSKPDFLDGSMYLARYTDGDSVKNLYGITTISGTGNTKSIEIFDNPSSTQTDLDSVKSELDATQTGAGLNANGSYSANTGSKYISGATSLNDADKKLAAALALTVNAKAVANSGTGFALSISGNSGTTVSTAADGKVTISGKIDNAIPDNILGLSSTTQGLYVARPKGVDIELGTYTKGSSYTAIATSDTVNVALGKLEKRTDEINANALTGLTAGNGISITGTGKTRNVAAKINTTDKVLVADNNGISATLSISYSSSDKKIYLYGKENGTTGDAISSIDATDFIKDGMLDSVKVVELSGGTSVNPGGIEDGKYLKFTFNTDSGESGKPKEDIYIDINDLAKIYTAGDGLSLSNNQFSVKLDPASENDYLSVGNSGLKLTGIGNIKVKTDNVQRGAGLSDGGIYQANSGSTYISGATSLNDADIKLDKALALKVNTQAVANTGTGFTLNVTGTSGITVTTASGGALTISGKVNDLEKNILTNSPQGFYVIRPLGAEIELGSYTKGSSYTAIASNDTVNEALGKLEKRTDDINAAQTNALTGLTAGNGISITGTGKTRNVAIDSNAVWDCGTY